MKAAERRRIADELTRAERNMLGRLHVNATALDTLLDEPNEFEFADLAEDVLNDLRDRGLVRFVAGEERGKPNADVASYVLGHWTLSMLGVRIAELLEAAG